MEILPKRRTAIISGGCGGVGRAVGKKLSDDGFDIVALYYSTPKETADAIVKGFGPGKHEAILCDIRNERAVAAVVAKVVETHGRIGACVHAAVDPILRKNILDIDENGLRDQLATGVFGGFHFIKTSALAMKDGGAIVGILSSVVRPDVPTGRMAGYVVAKYALRGLFKELYKELPGARFTVNAIAPDFMDTGLNGDIPKEVKRFILERSASGGMKTPEDVARAVSFLCSDAGKAISGKIFSFEKQDAF